MAGDTVITVVGNLTADPEIRYTQSGVAVATFTVASTPRTYDRQSGEWKDGEALFLRATAWRDYAEHVSKSLSKGMRVIVTGSLHQRSYEAQDGSKRTSYEISVDEVGPSLRYAVAEVTRMSGGGSRGGRDSSGSAADVWSAPATPSAPAPSSGANVWSTPGVDDQDTPF